MTTRKINRESFAQPSYTGWDNYLRQRESRMNFLAHRLILLITLQTYPLRMPHRIKMKVITMLTNGEYGRQWMLLEDALKMGLSHFAIINGHRYTFRKTNFMRH